MPEGHIHQRQRSVWTETWDADRIMAFNMLARGPGEGGGGDGDGGGGFYDVEGGACATLLLALLAAARDIEDKERGSSMLDDDENDEYDEEDDSGLFRPLAPAYGAAEDGDDDNGRPLVCPEEGCGQRFQHRSAMKRHMRRHLGDLPYMCLHSGCTKAFRESGALTMHTRVHSGERPFVCQVEACNKAFKASGALSRHMRVHSDERRFGCQYEGCDKAFKDSCALTVHMRVHTGERPYTCEHPNCCKSFMESGTLTRHKELHKNPHARANWHPRSMKLVQEGGSCRATPTTAVVRPAKRMATGSNSARSSAPPPAWPAEVQPPAIAAPQLASATASRQYTQLPHSSVLGLIARVEQQPPQQQQQQQQQEQRLQQQLLQPQLLDMQQQQTKQQYMQQQHMQQQEQRRWQQQQRQMQKPQQPQPQGPGVSGTHLPQEGQAVPYYENMPVRPDYCVTNGSSWQQLCPLKAAYGSPAHEILYGSGASPSYGRPSSGADLKQQQQQRSPNSVLQQLYAAQHGRVPGVTCIFYSPEPHLPVNLPTAQWVQGAQAAGAGCWRQAIPPQTAFVTARVSPAGQYPAYVMAPNRSGSPAVRAPHRVVSSDALEAATQGLNAMSNPVRQLNASEMRA